MSKKPVIRVALDPDEDEVVLSLEWGLYGSDHRLCPLDAWALLYCLDPLNERWSDERRPQLEALASERVGLTIAGNALILDLPHGSVFLARDMEQPLAAKLWEVLLKCLGDGA
jgi:hypothetical protein